jgi:hypothetical protein
MTQCSLATGNQLFGETYCLHFQGTFISPTVLLHRLVEFYVLSNLLLNLILYLFTCRLKQPKGQLHKNHEGREKQNKYKKTKTINSN